MLITGAAAAKGQTRGTTDRGQMANKYTGENDWMTTDMYIELSDETRNEEEDQTKYDKTKRDQARDNASAAQLAAQG